MEKVFHVKHLCMGAKALVANRPGVGDVKIYLYSLREVMKLFHVKHPVNNSESSALKNSP